MLRAAIAFFIIAIFAFALGDSGIAGISLEIGRLLLLVFLVLSLITFVVSLISGMKSKGRMM